MHNRVEKVESSIKNALCHKTANFNNLTYLKYAISTNILFITYKNMYYYQLNPAVIYILFITPPFSVIFIYFAIESIHKPTSARRTRKSNETGTTEISFDVTLCQKDYGRINEEKRKDLMSLLKFMPKNDQQFYNAIIQ